MTPYISGNRIGQVVCASLGSMSADKSLDSVQTGLAQQLKILDSQCVDGVKTWTTVRDNDDWDRKNEDIAFIKDHKFSLYGFGDVCFCLI